MAKKFKLILERGLAALCDGIQGAREKAEAAGSAASALAEATAKSLDEVDEALDKKQDKGTGVAVTIPASDWSNDSTAGYPKYYDISVAGVTASDRADVIVSQAGMPAAVACGLCPVTETLAGKIRIRAVSVPSASIAAQYWIEKGA